MIESIEINNFRNFHKSHIDGFKRINLIGGKNNGGKTTLLEAILLGCWPSVQAIDSLQINGRSFDKSILKYRPKLYWNNFFYKLNESKKISIKLHDTLLGSAKVSFFFEETNLYTTTTQNPNTPAPTPLPNDSFIVISQSLNDVSNPDIKIPVEISGQQVKSPSIFRQVEMFHPKSRLSIALLVSDFDSRSDPERAYFLEILKIIDNSIEEITSKFIGSPNLYVRSKNNNSLIPIQFYGDAALKAIELVSAIIKEQGRVILIDEIENGIHHSNQVDFWRILHTIANRFDVQIFATTHSQEMANALTKSAAKFGFEDEATYFELFRHPKTEEIDYNLMSMDVLDYRLKHNREFRGAER